MSRENEQKPQEALTDAFNRLCEHMLFLKGAPVLYFPTPQKLFHSTDSMMFAKLRRYPNAIVILEGEYGGDRVFSDIACGLLIRCDGKRPMGIRAGYEIHITDDQRITSNFSHHIGDEKRREIDMLSISLVAESRLIAAERIRDTAVTEDFIVFEKRAVSGRSLWSFEQATMLMPVLAELPIEKQATRITSRRVIH